MHRQRADRNGKHREHSMTQRKRWRAGRYLIREDGVVVLILASELVLLGAVLSAVAPTQ